jgi:hypothetical protein
MTRTGSSARGYRCNIVGSTTGQGVPPVRFRSSGGLGSAPRGARAPVPWSWICVPRSKPFRPYHLTEEHSRFLDGRVAELEQLAIIERAKHAKVIMPAFVVEGRAHDLRNRAEKQSEAVQKKKISLSITSKTRQERQRSRESLFMTTRKVNTERVSR